MILAWIGAAMVGVSLGLLGSGGAILTVPILVYLVHHNEKTAIAESLAIVACIAAVGALRAAGQKRVDVRSAVLLAVPGVLGTYLGALAAQWISGAVQLVLLAGLMLMAAALMFGENPGAPNAAQPGAPDATPGFAAGGDGSRGGGVALIAAQGVGLGMVTGLVGVGGGFLIVPVLVLLRRLPMPVAVGTSLAIIAANSSAGFLKYITLLRDHGVAIDWQVVGVFSALGVGGSLVGNHLAGRINKHALRRVFAVFLVVMAAYITVRQISRIMNPDPDVSRKNAVPTPAAPSPPSGVGEGSGRERNRTHADVGSESPIHRVQETRAIITTTAISISPLSRGSTPGESCASSATISRPKHPDDRARPLGNLACACGAWHGGAAFLSERISQEEAVLPKTRLQIKSA